MNLQKIKCRNYLVNEANQKKMIPIKYLDILKKTNISFDFDSKMLSQNERFLLEIELFKNNISTKEPYLYELIKNLPIVEASFVKCKFSVNRYEIKFGKYNVKVPTELYLHASEKIKINRFSDY